MSFADKYLEGKIDFEGQELANRIIHVGLISSTAVAFTVGFALQSLQTTFYTLGASTVLVALATIPPWPMYNRHPVDWLPIKPASTDTKKDQ